MAHTSATGGVSWAARGDAIGSDLLRGSWQTFVDLEAGREPSRVKQLMRRVGLLVPHHRGQRSYGDELSSRELEIARRRGEAHQPRHRRGGVPRNAIRELAISSATGASGAVPHRCVAG